MMNKILVKNNIVSSNITNLIDNKLVIIKNMDITIEYINSTNINLNIEIEKNIRVNLFIFSDNKIININNTYNIAENGYLNISKFYHNDKAVEREVINLNGYNSIVDYNFSTICQNEEEYNTIINHNNSNTISNVINKSITINDSKTIFNINSNLQKEKKNCILNQESRVILLGNNNSSINPNMYINDNDVIAKHSSVIGTFNEEELFYLMTRGITRQDSLKLLIKGFIFSSLRVDMDKREKILKIINKHWR